MASRSTSDGAGQAKENGPGPGTGNPNKNQLKILDTDKQTVQKMLECPNCLDICIPPVFQCNTGHHICEKCKNQLTKCPSCSADYRGTRNFFLENYFDNNCNFSCCFASDGCEQILAGKNLKVHQEKCGFRPLACGICRNAEIVIPYSKYLDHLMETHPCKIYDSKEKGEFAYNLVLNDNRLKPQRIGHWTPRLFKFQGHTFFACRVSLVQSRKLSFSSWVTIFGNEEQADRFRVQITIEGKIQEGGKKVAKYSICCEGPVLPLRLTCCSASSVTYQGHEGKCLFKSAHFINRILVKGYQKAKTNKVGLLKMNEKLDGSDSESHSNDSFVWVDTNSSDTDTETGTMDDRNDEDGESDLESPDEKAMSATKYVTFEEAVFPSDDDEENDPDYVQPSDYEDEDDINSGSDEEEWKYDYEQDEEIDLHHVLQPKGTGNILGFWTIKCKLIPTEAQAQAETEIEVVPGANDCANA